MLSAGIILTAREIFALGKEAEAISVILPENAAVQEVAAILKERGVVRSALLFRFYAGVRSWGKEYLAGEFELDRAMSYDELRAALAPRRGARMQVRVTIPEGLTTDEIIAIFTSRGIGTPEGFAQAIEDGGSFGYDFLEEIPQVPGRTYRLDGYLFPDTYFVFADSDEKEILQKLLDNFAGKFKESLRVAAKTNGFTVDEILRIASLIEKEAYFKEDMPKISSVFHNRLADDRFPYLESDATVRYAKRCAGDETVLSASDLRTVESPYNTYLSRGLPPGAICSPGLDAIRAAISPARTEYYYFVSADDKTTIFSRTYEEHRRAIASLSGHS